MAILPALDALIAKTRESNIKLIEVYQRLAEKERLMRKAGLIYNIERGKRGIDEILAQLIAERDAAAGGG